MKPFFLIRSEPGKSEIIRQRQDRFYAWGYWRIPIIGWLICLSYNMEPPPGNNKLDWWIARIFLPQYPRYETFSSWLRHRWGIRW